MALTIDDIYDKEFALKGGGYDRNDVDQFLDEICDEMYKMQDQIDALTDKLKKNELELNAARASAAQAAAVPAPVAVPDSRPEAPVARTSETLEGILLSAQKLADEAVENANRKADEIVKEAEDKASQIVDDAQNEKNLLSGQLDELKKNAADYKNEFLNMVNKYKSMLEEENIFAE